jgi:hypothetical protein
MAGSSSHAPDRASRTGGYTSCRIPRHRPRNRVMRSSKLGCVSKNPPPFEPTARSIIDGTRRTSTCSSRPGLSISVSKADKSIDVRFRCCKMDDPGSSGDLGGLVRRHNAWAGGRHSPRTAKRSVGNGKPLGSGRNFREYSSRNKRPADSQASGNSTSRDTGTVSTQARIFAAFRKKPFPNRSRRQWSPKYTRVTVDDAG